MKKLILIFTRDFNLWEHQMIRNQYVKVFPRVWGKGLTDQPVRYTGRSFEWLRYEQDVKKLKDYMIKKPLSSPLFQRARHDKFLRDVRALKKLMAVQPRSIGDDKAHYRSLVDLFRAMYPICTLCVFLPGAWHDEFLKSHGAAGKKAMMLALKSRHESEGLITLVGAHLRKWIGPKMQVLGYNSGFVKFLTVPEVERFVSRGRLPAKTVLAQRARGFVYFGDKVYPTKDFLSFLRERRIQFSASKESADGGEVRGQTAYVGGVVRGIVQTLYNESEVVKFKSGRILLTPMTSPTFLPAMKKAAAIVTDEGGLSCHAAIVARELKKPCVIGTKIATKVFKDGDKVEVDANKGVIKKLG